MSSLNNYAQNKINNRRAVLAVHQDKILRYIYSNITQSNKLTTKQVTQIARHFSMKEQGVLILLNGKYNITESKTDLKKESSNLSKSVADYAKEHFSHIGRLEIYQLEKKFERSTRSIMRYLKEHNIPVHNKDEKVLSQELARKHHLYQVHQLVKSRIPPFSGVDLSLMATQSGMPVRTFEKHLHRWLKMTKSARHNIKKLTAIEWDYYQNSFLYKQMMRNRAKQYAQDEILKMKLRKIIGKRDPLIPVTERLRAAKKLKISESRLTNLLFDIKAKLLTN